MALLSVIVTPVLAEETTFTITMQANYELDILGGAPLNPGMDTGYPFAVLGDMTFDLDSSLNDPMMTTAPLRVSWASFGFVPRHWRQSSAGRLCSPGSCQRAYENVTSPAADIHKPRRRDTCELECRR